MGYQKPIIVSGIAQYYLSEQIIGKQVPVVMNLAPRIIKGIESNGMVLFAIDGSVVDGVAGHTPVMLNPEKKCAAGISGKVIFSCHCEAVLGRGNPFRKFLDCFEYSQ